LSNILKHEALLERFAYRKEAGVSRGAKDFLAMKGAKGQIDH
jgi:hypothetical protein